MYRKFYQASLTKSAEPERTNTRTCTDNDLGEIDNSMVVDQDSEKDVQVENYKRVNKTLL